MTMPDSLIGLSCLCTDDLKFSQSEREPAPSSSQTKSESVNVPKALIKLYLHHSGDIAAKFEYNAVGCTLLCLFFIIKLNMFRCIAFSLCSVDDVFP